MAQLRSNFRRPEPFRQRVFLTVWQDRNKHGKEMSEGAIAGNILSGRTQAKFSVNMKNNILHEIKNRRKEGTLDMSDSMYRKIFAVLDRGNQEDIQALKEEQMSVSNRLQYEELKAKKIRKVQRKEEGLKILRSFSEKYEDPLYVDTESALYSLREGKEFDRLAMITVFDTRSDMVLLFRVHLMNDAELKEVRDAFRTLSETRKFASFDGEKFFYSQEGGGEIPCDTLQQYEEYISKRGKICKDYQSLQDAASQVGVSLDKSETISDWTAACLTNDQVVYAAMDAVVLHELRMKQLEDEEMTDAIVYGLPENVLA